MTKQELYNFWLIFVKEFKEIFKMKDWFKEKEPTLPKNLSDNEKHAVEIIQHLISRKDSEMYHNPQDFEWYIEANPYFVSIEAGKAVIINTDYSHEVRIDARTEHYLSHICAKEISKRRQEMKAKYMSKVHKNLSTILASIKSLP